MYKKDKELHYDQFYLFNNFGTSANPSLFKLNNADKIISNTKYRMNNNEPKPN